MDPRANPVNTIPILMAPANKLSTVARVPLSPIAEFSADPSTGQAKPRTRLSNQDAPIAPVVWLNEVLVEAEGMDSRDGDGCEKAFHVMRPYATVAVLSKRNSSPWVPSSSPPPPLSSGGKGAPAPVPPPPPLLVSAPPPPSGPGATTTSPSSSRMSKPSPMPWSSSPSASSVETIQSSPSSPFSPLSNPSRSIFRFVSSDETRFRHGTFRVMRYCLFGGR
mmetsp:Transcript_16860/g.38694  ORF Transcript_16860/g.38694 Transcript_16860/m.38694 type:complete len:221 (+) Transcript_16860:2236-2898(+)